MSWAKLDDSFPDNPKVVAAGGDAAWLHVCALCYCAQHLTDGRFAKALVPRLSDRKKPLELAARLVEEELWHDLGDEYEIHDYLEYNPSREQVESTRHSRKMAGAMGAAKRWASESHGTPHPSAIDIVNAPVPSPKEIKEPRKRKPVDNFLPTEAHGSYADDHGLRLEDERLAWIDWCEANGRTYVNLNAGFSTWLRQAVNFGRGKGGPTTVYANGKAVGDVSHLTRCPKCAGTGNYMRAGVLTICDHRETA